MQESGQPQGSPGVGVSSSPLCFVLRSGFILRLLWSQQLQPHRLPSRFPAVKPLALLEASANIWVLLVGTGVGPISEPITVTRTSVLDGLRPRAHASSLEHWVKPSSAVHLPRRKPGLLTSGGVNGCGLARNTCWVTSQASWRPLRLTSHSLRCCEGEGSGSHVCVT